MTGSQTIRAWFESLDANTFRNYAIAAGGTIATLIVALTYFYYQSTSSFVQDIEKVNEDRLEVRKLLANADRVKRQQVVVRKMLEENIDFKINGYLTNVLEKLQIDRYAEPLTSTQTDQNEQYREDTASTTLTGISMKEVAELLQELEKTEKIYIKELSISRDKKRAGTVKVAITIGTLVPKVGIRPGRT